MKIIKKLWPIILILFVWVIFSSPFFINNKVPFPSDYLVNNFAPWNAYPGFAGPVKNAATPDVITQIFPWKNLVIEMWKSGDIPLWNPYSFGGTPLLANYQSAALSPINLLYLVFPFIDAWSLQILLAPLLAGIFMYIFLRSLKNSQSGSIVGSISFMFCGFITTWMDYGTLTYAILFLPLSLLSIEKYSETKKWYFLTLLSITIPLSFFSGHFQISLYFLFFLTAYIFFKFIQSKELKMLIPNLLSVIFGLMLSAPQLLPSFEFYQAAVRSTLFIKIEDIPWGYLSTFVAPDYLGNPTTRNDWFGHYAEWNAYIGLIPLMLAFYSLRKRSNIIMFFLLMAVAAILLSFRSPVVDLLIALKIPVISTSAVGRIIVLFSFSFAVLAGFGFDNFIEDIKKGTYRGIAILFGIFIIIFSLLGIVAFTQLLPADKAAVAISNLKLPAILFFIFFISCLIASFVKGWRAVFVITTIIIFLTSFDMLRFANKWMPFQPKNLVYPQVQIEQTLKDIPKTDRVFGNFGGETYMTYRMSGVDGYDPLFISRFGELVLSAKDGLYHLPDRVGFNLPKDGEFTPNMINLLGIKYFVNKIADGRQPWAFPIHKYPTDQFKIIYQDEAYQVFENQKSYQRAFIVDDVEIETNNRKMLNKIFDEKTDLKKTVFLEEGGSSKSSETTGSARIISYEPNRVRIETNLGGHALLVLSDPFYPGWKAEVNGKSTRIYRANYALRAIEVPKGLSNVEFKYEPDSFRNGLILAVIGILGIIGLVGYNIRRR